MADFMKVDMSRLGQAEGRSADSGMAAPSGADVDTFQQAMRRRPLDERQGSGGDESDGGRGASHAPDEDTSAEAEALSSMFSRMTGPLDTLFAGRTAQTAETAAPSGDAPDLGALAEKLVERILVSGPPSYWGLWIFIRGSDIGWRPISASRCLSGFRRSAVWRSSCCRADWKA